MRMRSSRTRFVSLARLTVSRLIRRTNGRILSANKRVLYTRCASNTASFFLITDVGRHNNVRLSRGCIPGRVRRISLGGIRRTTEVGLTDFITVGTVTTTTTTTPRRSRSSTRSRISSACLYFVDHNHSDRTSSCFVSTLNYTGKITSKHTAGGTVSGITQFFHSGGTLGDFNCGTGRTIVGCLRRRLTTNGSTHLSTVYRITITRMPTSLISRVIKLGSCLGDRGRGIPSSFAIGTGSLGRGAHVGKSTTG